MAYAVHGGRRSRRWRRRARPLGAEEIAHLDIVEGVLGQGGVNAILELRALADEHHARAGKVTLVAELAWGNPDRR